MKIDDDDFTLMGLPQRFALERSQLDQRWRQLQAEVHPDRFTTQGTASQRVAMQWAVRVNEAYQRLKDPLRRGACLCQLRGVPVDVHSNTAMPAAFLLTQMAWREALDDAEGIEAVSSLDAEVADEERRMLQSLQRLLDVDGDTQAAAQQVRALMFVARFRADIDRRLETLES